ncbi:MAG: hypothetical protein BGO30_03140 [Bacteroidetes bacterium 41-46]|nr:MAG: hypothetical protein BGO30_03140 [Bacteroidetes bacterium 41-46]
MNTENNSQKVAKIVEDSMGLTFLNSRMDEFSRHLSEAVKTMGFNDIDSFYSKVLSSGNKFSPDEKRVLAAHLTVSETYFFRERPAMSMFIKIIMPELIKNKHGKKIKIWSAGCSSGEEPYTLSMLINENFPFLNSDSYSITATDINPNVLTKAKNGLYTAWSFREAPELYIKKYFTKIGENYQISQKIKDSVNFEFLNLASDRYPGELPGEDCMDIIFCRNVLMYFNHGMIKQIAQRFYNVLSHKGWFIASQVELNDDFFGHFKKRYSDEGVFYYKDEVGEERIRTIPAPGKRIDHSNHLPKRDKQQIDKIDFQEPNFEEKPFINSELELLYSQGRYQECIESSLTEIKKGNTESTIMGFLARSYANTGQYKEAIAVLDKLLTLEVSSDDIFYLYGTILNELSEIDRAKTMFRRGLYLNPEHLMSHLMLGNILRSEGNNRAALIHYRNVAEITERLKEDELIKTTGGINRERMLQIVEKLIENQ